MVKGISRRVVVVRSPDAKLFEEAIFFVRDGAGSKGVTREQLLEEAKRVVHGSDPGSAERKKERLKALVAAAVGAAATGALWLLTVLI